MYVHVHINLRWLCAHVKNVSACNTHYLRAYKYASVADIYYVVIYVNIYMYKCTKIYIYAKCNTFGYHLSGEICRKTIV